MEAWSVDLLAWLLEISCERLLQSGKLENVSLNFLIHFNVMVVRVIELGTQEEELKVAVS